MKPIYNLNHILRDMDGLRRDLWGIALSHPHRLESRLVEIEGIHSLLGKVIERVKRHGDRDAA